MKRYPTLLRLLVLRQASVLTMALSILSVAILLTVTYRLRRHHDDDLIEACRRAAAILIAQEVHGQELPAVRTLAGPWNNVSFRELAGPTEGVSSDPAAMSVELANVHAEGEHATHEGVDMVADRVGRCRIRTPSGAVYAIEARETLGDLASAIDSLRWIILIVAPIVLVLAISTGALILRRALWPLRQIVRWVGTVDASRLDSWIGVIRGPEDINVLVQTFNQMIERLDTSFERMSQFTANASHELRTPLASLISTIEVSLQQPRSLEDQQRVLKRSLAEMRRLTTIVEQLLTVAQADTERIDLRPELLNLSTLLLDSLEAVHLQASAKGVSVELEEVEDPEIVAEPLWLRQLFDNLVQNAVKYTPRGGSVVISATCSPSEVIVNVTDTGVGIPSDRIDRIFDRYERVDTTGAAKVAGVGLGLSIADGVAQAHGGRIEVESELGHGSCFSVVLPRSMSM